MKTHLGEEGTEQFSITTKVDGKIIAEQKIHDPFIHSSTFVGISRWDLLKAMFKKQFQIKVEVSVRGSEGAMRAIMTLCPDDLTRESESILEDRRQSRAKLTATDIADNIGWTQAQTPLLK